MALTGPEFHDFSQGGIVLSAAGQRCVYCGGHLEDPACMWDGATAPIYMHVSCAVNLGIRISRDVWEYQKKTGIKAVST